MGTNSFLNKNITFNKKENESKMENPTYSFRKTNLVLHLIWESQTKSKTVMSWSSWMKKRVHFLYSLFCPNEIFFNICVLSQCIVYWIHFQNIHSFTYQKTSFYTLLGLFLKWSKAFSVSLYQTRVEIKMLKSRGSKALVFSLWKNWKLCTTLHTVNSRFWCLFLQCSYSDLFCN